MENSKTTKIRPREESTNENNDENPSKRRNTTTPKLNFSHNVKVEGKIEKKVKKFIDDPNMILISKTTPRSKVISHILSRLSDETNETNNVILLASNSAMQSCISIAEIIKRTLPDSKYRIDIGSTFKDDSDPNSGKAYAIRIEFVL